MAGRSGGFSFGQALIMYGEPAWLQTAFRLVSSQSMLSLP
jgi:hypothetical protein